MGVFSPFQTQLYSRCPLLRRLMVKERWVPRRIEQRDISAILGVAIGKGLEIYNKVGEAPAPAAWLEAHRLQVSALDAGRTLPERHTSQWDRVPGRAEAAVNAYMKIAPDMPPGLPEGSRIAAVEHDYGPAGGYSRPDLLVDDGLSPRVPYDYKTTLSLGPKPSDWAKNKERRIAQWADSHQLFTYASLEGVLHYYIGFMVLEPEFAFETLLFQIHPETMAMWKAGAVQTWRDMEEEDAGRRVPAMAASHSDEFGECPMKAACFEHHLDPALMGRDYVRVER